MFFLKKTPEILKILIAFIFISTISYASGIKTKTAPHVETPSRTETTTRLENTPAYKPEPQSNINHLNNTQDVIRDNNLNQSSFTDSMPYPATGIIYRRGSATDTQLTPRTVDKNGLSANINPAPGKNQAIDTSKFEKLCATCDNPKTGHISITPKDMNQMTPWIKSRNTAGEPHPLTKELRNSIIEKSEIHVQKKSKQIDK